MLFNSLEFLIFLPLTVLFYYLLPHRFRWVLLLVASCVFYMAFVPKYILILFAIILIDYVAAIVIERAAGERKKKAWLAFSLISNLALLAFFKYFNFLNENLTWLAERTGHYNPIPYLNIILPLGLSFHTFQSMAYTIDVYHQKQKAERHLGYYSLFVLFFPQMVAGPIERFRNLGVQLKEKVQLNYENLSNGFRLILYGLFIKMVVADNLGEYVNQIYEEPERFNYSSILCAVFFYSFQMYGDFLGYSTIALGAARLMGFNMMRNFDSPFSSTSMTEFWRRWHISLSTWFNDYLFTPLTISFRSLGKQGVALAILVTFFFSGLWHGANWTYVLWGCLHGIVIAYEMYTKKFRKKLSQKIPPLIYDNISRLLMFCYATFSWIVFRSDSFGKLREILGRLFGATPTGDVNLYINFLYVLYPLAAFILFDYLFYNKPVNVWLGEKATWLRWSVYFILIGGILCLSGLDTKPFIYFQF